MFNLLEFAPFSLAISWRFTELTISTWLVMTCAVRLPRLSGARTMEPPPRG